VGNLTLRLRWYSGLSLYGLGALAFFVVLGFFAHSAFWGAALVAVLWVWYMFGMKIEVTSMDVGMSRWLLRRGSAPREAIRAMHWFGPSVTFVDADHRVLLKLSSLGWSGSQWLDVSEALGVHLYNHRTKRGFGTDAQQGQLMQRATEAK